MLSAAVWRPFKSFPDDDRSSLTHAVLYCSQNKNQTKPLAIEDKDDILATSGESYGKSRLAPICSKTNTGTRLLGTLLRLPSAHIYFKCCQFFSRHNPVLSAQVDER